jgi:hypothetical protein
MAVLNVVSSSVPIENGLSQATDAGDIFGIIICHWKLQYCSQGNIQKHFLMHFWGSMDTIMLIFFPFLFERTLSDAMQAMELQMATTQY